MGFIVLPLHIWDRELDSRILLSALLASEGNIVILGHEYNLSPIYKHQKNIFHYGAGRPIYNEPRTNDWYEPIIENGGFNGLVFEEGLNDIEGSSEAMFKGINSRSEKSTSIIYSWTEKEKELLVKNTRQDLKYKIANKVRVCGNTRLELLGEVGKYYYEDTSRSLSNIFGNFVLVSDNFGGIEMYGSKKKYDPRRDLMQRCEKEEFNQIMEDIETRIQKSKQSRIEFCKVINQLIIDHPHIPFILRPHPIADPDFWYKNIIKRRNINILCKDNVQPWINASALTIHSGCTVGIEAELSKNMAADISLVCQDQRTLGLSSKVSKHKPKSYSELCTLISESLRIHENKTVKDRKNISNLDWRNLIQSNLLTLDQGTIEKLKYRGHEIKKISSLMQVSDDARDFFNGRTMIRDEQIKLLSSVNELVKSQPPLQQKSRYFTAIELNKKMKKALEVLNRKKNLNIIKLRRENVFAVIPEQF